MPNSSTEPTVSSAAPVTVQDTEQDTELDLQENHYFNKLRRLQNYVRYPFKTHYMTGRCTHQATETVLIHWPQITDLSLRHMRRDFYPDDLCAAECDALGIRTPDVKFIVRRLKEIIEALVRPMLVSPYVRSSQQIVHEYAQKAEAFTGLTRDAGYRDPSGYTLYRRFILHKTTTRRLYTPFMPRDKEVFADCVPEHFACLQELWEALSNRHESAFDSFDAGVEYLPSGILAVNWLRYVRALSQGLVPGVKVRVLDARKITTDLERESRALGRFLVTRRDTSVFDTLVQPLLMREFCTQDEIPFMSFFDPFHAYLGKHERLFKGAWHFHRADVARKKRDMLRKGLRDRDPLRLPRAIPLTFKPWDYIEKDVERGILPTPWFDRNYQEPIYTVRSRKEYCFRRPSRLSEAAVRCPAEAETWRRALDALHIIEVAHPSNPDVVTELNPAELKSEFLQRARRDFLDKAARIIIKDYRGLDSLRRKDMKAVKKKVQQMFMEEQSAANTANTRWYHDGVLKQEQITTDIADLRAQLQVRFPDEKEPRQGVFFRPSALKVFMRFATPPLPSSDAGVDMVRDAMANAWRPAPYVLAWTRFCTSVVAKADTFGEALRLTDNDADLTTQWSPREDITLLMHYRGYPALTREEWHALLPQLHDRTQGMAYQRILTLRKALKRVLRPASLKRLWPGSVADDEVNARQIVFIFGAAQKLKIRHTADNEVIGRILKLSPEQTMYLSVPNIYSTVYFRSFRP